MQAARAVDRQVPIVVPTITFNSDLQMIARNEAASARFSKEQARPRCFTDPAKTACDLASFCQVNGVRSLIRDCFAAGCTKYGFFRLGRCAEETSGAEFFATAVPLKTGTVMLFLNEVTDVEESLIDAARKQCGCEEPVTVNQEPGKSQIVGLAS